MAGCRPVPLPEGRLLKKTPQLFTWDQDWGRLVPLQHHLVAGQAVNHSLSVADPNVTVASGKAIAFISFFLFFARSSLRINPCEGSSLGIGKTDRQGIRGVHNL